MNFIPRESNKTKKPPSTKKRSSSLEKLIEGMSPEERAKLLASLDD